MVQFSLFGVPIRVHPLHWVGLAVIGGMLNMRDLQSLPIYLLFIIAGFLVILAHEMGHALIGRRYGGGSASVDLIILGGYTQFYGNRFTSGFGKKAMIAAGCTVNLMTVVLCAILIFFLQNMQIGSALNALITCIWGANYSGMALYANGFIAENMIFPYTFIGAVVFTSFWWGLLNLLPIYPMDGGKILDEFVKSHKTTHIVGLILASILGVFAFMTDMIFLGVFMIFFAFENYKLYRANNF